MNEKEKRIISKGSFESGTYTCQYDWPDDCFVQCGGDGLVVSAESMEEVFENPAETIAQVIGVEKAPENSYRTAFFEAFPRIPNTFIRGEGGSIEQAETVAWEKYQKHSACEHPEFEKRGYENGVGFCVVCGMFSSQKFAPWEKCPICDYPIYPDSEECYHCHLFEVGDDGDEDGFLSQYIKESRSAALWLIQQDIHCPDCSAGIIDMRFVSSSDYRLNEEENRRQDVLYQKAVQHAMVGKPIFSRPDRRLTFPFSIFYECECSTLKLIVDLAGEWVKENHDAGNI